jgi:2-alkyl-3-oxoalkanoate reductase
MRKGRLPVIGPGDNRVDLTYIDNAVQAVERALSASERCFGRKYNISNGEPVAIWDFLRKLSEALALPPPRGRVPYGVALRVSRVVEGVHRTLGLAEPRISPYGVQTLALTMTLDISAARNELGYAPTVSIDEGLTRFVRWWKEQA